MSKFQLHMRDRCQFLPIWVLLLYSYVHAVFNQDELLAHMIDKKALLFEEPWVDWKKLLNVIRKAKQHNQKTRSSNYYNSTLKHTLPQFGYKALRKPVDAVERDVRVCQLVRGSPFHVPSAIFTMPLPPETTGRQCCKGGCGRHILGAQARSITTT